MRRLLLTILFFNLMLSLSAQHESPKRELRAVWLTTLNGLDWPRTRATGEASRLKQQRELCDMLDRLKAANFNAVIMQARIRSTVIYPSTIEPWDECLTGRIDGHPGYDPLQFAIDECHKRGLELHAWVVAFPGHKVNRANRMGRKAMNRRLPSLCIKAGDQYMLNPGEPATADYLADICEEITRSYDIDGISLDYIRYPERSIPFGDAQTYRRLGHGQAKDQWRRDNVTRCVREIHHRIKAIKPWVCLSCSPVGKSDDLPRQTSRGWNAYSTVYQDAQGWLRDGLMDMLTPMMYFRAGSNFYPFAADWQEQSAGRIFAAGLAAYKLDRREGDWDIRELQDELHYLRNIGAGGAAFFRHRFVDEDGKGLYRWLADDFYRTPALTPAISDTTTPMPQPPTSGAIGFDNNGYRVHWTAVADTTVRYNLYRSSTYPVDTDHAPLLYRIRLSDTCVSVPYPVPAAFVPYYAVTAIDRYGRESSPLHLNAPIHTVVTGDTIMGPVRLDATGDTLLLPDVKAGFVVVENLVGRILLSYPYAPRLAMPALPPGEYRLRSIARKKNRTTLLARICIRGQAHTDTTTTHRNNINIQCDR